MLLYKYRSDSNFTEQILTEQKIWLSKPGDLNDPFECSIQNISNEWIEKQVRKEKQEKLDGFIFTIAISSPDELLWGLSSSKINALLKRIANEKKFGKKYKIYKDFIFKRTGNYPSSPYTIYKEFQKQLLHIGIFSLSETIDNQLMWAHYADSSKGIAIGFSVEENTILADKNKCIKVNYCDEVVKVNERLQASLNVGINENSLKFHQQVDFNDPFFQTAISTKTTPWKYESEWRYVDRIPGLRPLPAPIKEIVFGVKCPKDIRRKYIDLSKNITLSEISFCEMVKEDTRLIKCKIDV